jgi:hypothetical protein
MLLLTFICVQILPCWPLLLLYQTVTWRWTGKLVGLLSKYMLNSDGLAEYDQVKVCHQNEVSRPMVWQTTLQLGESE